jgi:lipoprotein NlpD
MNARTNRPRFPFAVALALPVLMAGCMTRPPAPISERAPLSAPPAPPPMAKAPRAPEREWRPETYTVKRGDTLYQIALDHGLDYRELAAWNNIENVNRIQVGQLLVLAPPGQPVSPGGAVTAPLATVPPVAPSAQVRPPPGESPARANTATFKTGPRAIKLPYSEQALAQLQQQAAGAAAPTDVRGAAIAAAAAAPAAAVPPVAASAAAPPRADAGRVPEIDDQKIDWVWPATGKIVASFSETANLKGIDIAGKAGQPVVASAAGKVTYAGDKLRGYGKLIVIQHNDRFLSVYGHNKEILVKEGQQVAKGQKIAEMGDTDADRVVLHFEIRRLGKPVDPIRYLPPG